MTTDTATTTADARQRHIAGCGDCHEAIQSGLGVQGIDGDRPQCVDAVTAFFAAAGGYISDADLRFAAFLREQRINPDSPSAHDPATRRLAAYVELHQAATPTGGLTTAERDGAAGVDALVDSPEMAALTYAEGWRDGVRYLYTLDQRDTPTDADDLPF